MVDYEKVVKAALEGNENAFSQLYESTQHDMYYIALKYMKNEEDAMDVIQDSYIKAWKSLGTLQDPAHFPAWLGRIVANTAKNMLVKRKPTLFSDLDRENEEGDSFAYEIEDEKAEYQPERNYTQKETQELVHELIDSLSEEQRLCILMYHLDDQSIKDIAETFGISENTVKSRLSYGRKAIKTKAEALKKQGYQLYTAAPVGVLLYLLLSEKKSEVFAATADTVMKAQRRNIMSQTGTQTGGAGTESTGNEEKNTGNENSNNGEGSGNSESRNTNTRNRTQDAAKNAAQKTTAKTAGKAAGNTFLHTTAGKIIATVAAIAVVGGGAAGILQYRNAGTPTEQTATGENASEALEPTEIPIPTDTPAPTETPAPTDTPVPTETPAPTNTPTPSPEPTTPPVQKLADEEYSSKIAGNLTKEELELVLAYGPDEIPETATSEWITYTLNELCQGVNANRERVIQAIGTTEDWKRIYSMDEINRFFASFTDFQFTEGYADGGVQAQNGNVIFAPAELSWSTTVSITDTGYTDSVMKIHYTYTKTNGTPGEEDMGVPATVNRVATLVPRENNLYRIIKIEEDTGAPDDFESEDAQTQNTPEAADENHAEPAPGENENDAAQNVPAEAEVASVYESVLQHVAANEDGYTFTEIDQEYLTGSKCYTLYDIDQDGIQELIIGAEFKDYGKYLLNTYHVYTCEPTENGYQAMRVSGDGFSVGCEAAPDGNGILKMSVSLNPLQTSYYRGTIQDGVLTFEDSPFYVSDQNSDMSASPIQNILTWTDISDMSGLGK